MPWNKTKGKQLSIQNLSNKETRNKYKETLKEKVIVLDEVVNLQSMWTQMMKAIVAAAENTVGFKDRSYQMKSRRYSNNRRNLN